MPLSDSTKSRAATSVRYYGSVSVATTLCLLSNRGQFWTLPCILTPDCVPPIFCSPGLSRLHLPALSARFS
jgi:hypothetical protein